VLFSPAWVWCRELDAVTSYRNCDCDLFGSWGFLVFKPWKLDFWVSEAWCERLGLHTGKLHFSCRNLSAEKAGFQEELIGELLAPVWRNSAASASIEPYISIFEFHTRKGEESLCVWSTCESTLGFVFLRTGYSSRLWRCESLFVSVF